MRKSETNVKTFEGMVAWFDDKLGFGFIECAPLGKNVFIHHTRIVSNEKWKTLSAGQFVTFEVTDTKKGLMAVNVQERKVIPVKAEIMSNGTQPVS